MLPYVQMLPPCHDVTIRTAASTCRYVYRACGIGSLEVELMSNVAITEWGEERSGLNEEQVILILIDIDTAILVVVAILVAHSRCRQAPDYNVCVDNSPCLNHCLFCL